MAKIVRVSEDDLKRSIHFLDWFARKYRMKAIRSQTPENVNRYCQTEQEIRAVIDDLKEVLDAKE